MHGLSLVCKDTHAHTHTLSCMHTHMYVHTCMRTNSHHTHACTHIHKHTHHTHACTQTHTSHSCMHTHARTQACTQHRYTHMHTYTLVHTKTTFPSPTTPMEIQSLRFPWLQRFSFQSPHWAFAGRFGGEQFHAERPMSKGGGRKLQEGGGGLDQAEAWHSALCKMT